MISGVVYEINMDECFYAWEDGPALLNGKNISVAQTRKLDDSLIATGFPYTNFAKLEQYLKLLEDLMKSSRGIRRLGSAAADLAYVACGRFDAFYEYGLNPWDVAGGSFIVQRAGGIVSDFKGNNDYIHGGNIIASNPLVYNELMEKVAHYFQLEIGEEN